MHKITLADMVANVRRADIKRHFERKKNRNVESRTLIPMKNRDSRKTLRERDHLWSSEISNFPGRAASKAESKQPRRVSRVWKTARPREDSEFQGLEFFPPREHGWSIRVISRGCSNALESVT